MVLDKLDQQYYHMAWWKLQKNIPSRLEVD